MHSYKSLAVFALAVSTASTAYSAPLQESQQQDRSVNDAPLNVGRVGLIGGDAIDILSHIHGIKHPKPEASRDTIDLDRRVSASGVGGIISNVLHTDAAKNVIGSLAGGAAGALTTYIANKFLGDTRRDVPLDLSHCSGPNPDGAEVCSAKRYTERDDVSTQDALDVLRLLGRQLIELD